MKCTGRNAEIGANNCSENLTFYLAREPLPTFPLLTAFRFQYSTIQMCSCLSGIVEEMSPPSTTISAIKSK